MPGNPKQAIGIADLHKPGGTVTLVSLANWVYISIVTLGGDMVSTWVAKPEVHAEVRVPRKTVRKQLVANDDNYALAA